MIAISGMAFAKPLSNKKDNLISALLALQQEEGEGGDRKSVKQDNNDNGQVLEQMVEEDPVLIMMEGDEPDPSTFKDAMTKKFDKLNKKEKAEVLTKLQSMKKEAKTDTEVQWWHHIFHHFFRHVNHHIFHHW